ncbi:type II toxin-antitoxin system CcdA family antitoxin [Salipiger sp. PrR003]|uniref:type II toxin-antitoxin system CcdA family antitoxin n=1 Tax=Salipiger sp. PrR003 TaxID=2706776 RepID=UPI0013DBE550|nr:type II toxin-antitoxin system CcdA family antitoxin [Salipiger sp. PrR003]NDV50191.1 type II toxin-antitoxin system CcdA family antitoxin [Salipiger sp. PrR003]
MRDQAKKSTRITLERGVLEEARRLGINISKAAESGVLAAIRAERARVWHQVNADAIAEYNALIEANGLPLSEYRKF